MCDAKYATAIFISYFKARMSTILADNQFEIRDREGLNFGWVKNVYPLSKIRNESVKTTGCDFSFLTGVLLA